METSADILWQVNILGTLSAVCTNGERIEHFQTRPTAALFAYLAFHATEPTAASPISREVLAEMLWPGAPPAATRKRLAQAVSWLRHRLERNLPPNSVLETDRQSVRLRPEKITTDVGVFLQRLTEAEQTHEYEAAVAAYRGALLPSFYDDWVLQERERLTSLYLAALHGLITSSEQQKDGDRALRHAHTAIAADPFDGTAHEAVVRLLASAGQSSAALRHYGDWERRLKAEGRAPAASLRALAERLRATEAPVAIPDVPPTWKTTVAAPLTRFFGRENEITEVVSLLGMPDVRLVTLSGTGGTGKTRLALEAARRLRRLPGRETVIFVPLADLTEAAHIPAAIAEALFRADAGAQSAPPAAVSAWDFVLERLSRRPVVLVLDNLEHLLSDGQEARQMVRHLLQASPRLTVLITSRQRLGIAGEQEFPVPPLPIPALYDVEKGRKPIGSIAVLPSVQLFVNRVQAVRPDFQLTAANAPVVADLCTRLEGIPLAIELCAAWAQILTPTQMREKLTHRFDLLVSRRVDIEARHRTLRATLEYGYLLLNTEARRLFSQLALFQGGWTLPAAEAVCTRSSDGNALLLSLTELRERSLIVADADPVSGGMRFRMLETLREFAGEQLSLSDATEWRRHHADYFLGIAEETEPDLSGPEQGRGLNLLETEHDNLRVALTWLLTADRESGLRLAGALGPFWDTRGHLREGRDWLTRLLKNAETDAPAISHTVLAKAWSTLGRLAWSQGDFAEAADAHQTALALWRETGDVSGIAWSLYDLAATLYRQGESAASRALAEESLALAERYGDDACVARALNQLGNLTIMDAESVAFYQRSLDVSRARGDRQYTATALHNLGTNAGLRGDHPAADAYFQAALAIRRELRDDYGVVTTLMNLGKNALLQNQLTDARALLVEAARLAWETGRKLVLAFCLKDLGLLTLAEGEAAAGVFSISTALALSEQIAAPIGERHREEYETALADARQRLGPAAYEVTWSRGKATPLAEIFTDPILMGTRPQSESPKPPSPLLPEKRTCVGCGGAHLRRHGFAPNGKQKYRCADCGRGTRENPGTNGYDAATRASILAVYRAGGVSLRGLTRRYGVSRNTVLAWLHEPAR